MGDHMIRAIQFNGDGSVGIDFICREDQRVNMMMSRVLMVAPPEDGDSELADELEDLERTAERVLRSVMSQHELASPPPIERSDDDLPGPYDNPLER